VARPLARPLVAVHGPAWLQLLDELDRRGITVERRPGSAEGLLVRPEAALTLLDRQRIVRHKSELVTLLSETPQDARVRLDPPSFEAGPIQWREWCRVQLAGVELVVTPREWIDLVFARAEGGSGAGGSAPAAVATSAVETPAAAGGSPRVASARQRQLWVRTA
jgi:hypothetical protein